MRKFFIIILSFILLSYVQFTRFPYTIADSGSRIGNKGLNQRLVIKESIRITNDSLSDRTPFILQDRNGSFFAYYASYEGEPPPLTHDLRSSFSQDGRVWSSPNYMPAPYWRGYPSAIQDKNGTYWMVWEDCGNRSGLRIANSTNGIDWNAEIILTEEEDFRPSLIQDANDVYWIAYEHYPPGAEDIQIRQSDNGIDWSNPIQVTPLRDETCDVMPDLFQDSNGTYWLVWIRRPPEWDRDLEIWISQSLDCVNWEAPSQIQVEMESLFPSLIQGENGEYVLAWIEQGHAEGGEDIHVMRSDDCINWAGPQRITSNNVNGFPRLMRNPVNEYYIAYVSWNEETSDDLIMDIFTWTNPPTATFTITPRFAPINEIVTFNASESYDEDGEIVSYNWDFGDSSTGNGETVTHAYVSEGTYPVSLTVRDNDGVESVRVKMIVVDIEAGGPPIISVKGSKAIMSKGYHMNFNVTIQDKWDFAETFNLSIYANSSMINSYIGINKTSTNTTITFAWNASNFSKGNYTITAFVHTPDITIHERTDVFVTIPGDIDADLDVDIYDITLMAGQYGEPLPQVWPITPADIDNDLDVDIYDIIIAISNYSET